MLLLIGLAFLVVGAFCLPSLTMPPSADRRALRTWLDSAPRSAGLRAGLYREPWWYRDAWVCELDGVTLDQHDAPPSRLMGALTLLAVAVLGLVSGVAVWALVEAVR